MTEYGTNPAPVTPEDRPYEEYPEGARLTRRTFPSGDVGFEVGSKIENGVEFVRVVVLGKNPGDEDTSYDIPREKLDELDAARNAERAGREAELGGVTTSKLVAPIEKPSVGGRPSGVDGANRPRPRVIRDVQ